MDPSYDFTDPEFVRTFILYLERITSPIHDTSGHQWEPHPNDPSVCKHCFWLDPNGPINPIFGLTEHERARALLRAVRAVQNGQMSVVVIPNLQVKVGIYLYDIPLN